MRAAATEPGTPPAMEGVADAGAWWADRRALAIALVAALVAAIPLAHGFTYDDRPIVLFNDRVHSIAHAWRIFGQSYWPPSHGGDLYRPVTMLGFAIQWSLGRGAPVVFHFANLALYVALCVAVLRLFDRLLPKTAALATAAIFAVHPVHVEAVADVVGQAELWVALACVLATIRYLDVRMSRGAFAPRDIVYIAVAYAVACFAKENGVVLPALLVAAEITVRPNEERFSDRVRRMVPLFAGLAAVVVLWMLARGAAIGWRAGDVPNAALDQLSRTTRWWTMLGVATEWFRLLLWPARLVADYAPREILILDAPYRTAWLGLAGLVVTVLVALIAWRSQRVVTFGIAWAAIAIAPVSNLLVITGILLAERTLLLPSVGSMLIIGCGVAWLERHATATARTAVRVAVAVLALLGAARSMARAREWKDNRTLAAATVRDAPASYRAHYNYGAALFDAGDKHAGERELLTAILLFPSDPQPHADLGNEYRRSHLCTPALPQFRSALAIDSVHTDARVGLIACFLEDAQFDSASAYARAGIATGRAVGTFQRLLAISDSVAAVRNAPGQSAAPPQAR